jgi:uncharacterized protein YgbK (DUF1537 family)
MYLGAIADDLTGATDLALILSQEGLRVLQTVGVPDDADFGDADAVVVSLKSRTIPAREAVSMSLAATRALLGGGARQLFFKYCSTFDSTDAGNIGPVIDALLTLVGEERTIACPAFPMNQRTIYRGHLFVGDQLLSDSPMKDHPLTPMRDASLVRVLSRQTERPVALIPLEVVRDEAALASRLAQLAGIAIVDAVADDDLRRIGSAVAGLKLVTGGSGVAMGLAANFGVHAGPPAEPLVWPTGGSAVLAGSCSAATLRQVAAAEAAGIPAFAVDPVAVAAGTLTPSQAIDFVLAQSRTPLVYSSAPPSAVAATQQRLGQAEAGELIERFMADVAAGLSERGVTRFIVAGGETSGAVVAALGVNVLRIGPEIDPGVPWTLAHGNAAPFALALKSGNFGSDDFFIRAWEKLA